VLERSFGKGGAVANLPDELFIDKLANEVDLISPEQAPSDLKARLYSALMRQQVETGPLSSLTDSKAHGHDLCVFERLVEIAPLGEPAKSLNICRVCHARVLAEHFENAPIYWNGCPYVQFRKS
jgi:hypothetical protein